MQGFMSHIRDSGHAARVERCFAEEGPGGSCWQQHWPTVGHLNHLSLEFAAEPWWPVGLSLAPEGACMNMSELPGKPPIILAEPLSGSPSPSTQEPEGSADDTTEDTPQVETPPPLDELATETLAASVLERLKAVQFEEKAAALEVALGAANLRGPRLAKGWEAFAEPCGDVWYYHAASGEASYEVPAAVGYEQQFY